MPQISQKASASIITPKVGIARNILTRIDELGLFASLERIDGESTGNFRQRLYGARLKQGNASVKGLTDSISRAFVLGHERVISVTVDRDIKLDVEPTEILVSGVGVNANIELISMDPDGYWTMPLVYEIVNALSSLSGITAATISPAMSGLPGILLEEQSSYVTEYNETVPPVSDFKLGFFDDGIPIVGRVIQGTVAFNDDLVFANEISGIPHRDGEWSVDINTNTIHAASLIQAPVRMSYTYNLLTSGSTMNLLANGAKVINLSDARVQPLLLTTSGIGESGQQIINELYAVDKSFWGS